MVFVVIISTVVLQSITAKPLAKRLGVRAPPPKGFLLFGGSKFSRFFAQKMQAQGIGVCITDTNWDSIREARMLKIPVYFGTPISEHASRNLDLSSIGTVLILSPYRQFNPLVSYHFTKKYGENRVWDLTNNQQDVRPSHQVSQQYASKLVLFGEGITYGFLASAVNRGAQVKTTRLSEEFSFEDYAQTYEDRAIPFIMIDANERYHIIKNNTDYKAGKGCKVTSLILTDDSETPP